MKMYNEDLKPCQTCVELGQGDHNAIFVRDTEHKGRGWQVRCTWCDTETTFWDTREEAGETWNDIYSTSATEESRNK